MKTISLKVTDPFDVELTGMAKRHGMSKSALIREALETYLRTGRGRGNGSALSLADDLAGDRRGSGRPLREQGPPAEIRRVTRNVILDTGPLVALLQSA